MALIVFTVIEGRCDSSGFVDDLGSPCTLSVFRPGILLPHACEPVPAHLLSREDIRTCVQRDSDNLRDDVPRYIKASCEHDVKNGPSIFANFFKHNDDSSCLLKMAYSLCAVQKCVFMKNMSNPIGAINRTDSRDYVMKLTNFQTFLTPPKKNSHVFKTAL